ncbi:MAG: glycosyltransferase family 2 protein [Acidobacteriia bacterium]|nr:glycosyltransferase family 2 protein [Terriglobia bacterium]
MPNQPKHISICVCTYKRPILLQRLLQALLGQETLGLFTFSIVVVDNDRLRSAEPVVSDFAAAAKLIPVRYCEEPRQNIALARNKAVENASGDFVAIIDDDEFPEGDWLLKLFTACEEYRVDGVLGPVKRYFDEEPPGWIVKGHFYERPSHPTGHIMPWMESRTGNLLTRREVFHEEVPPFRPAFRAGEDQDFFRRMAGRGRIFIWCNEAVVYEVVTPSRWKRIYMLRKALLRGETAALHPTVGPLSVIKSVIAVPAYVLALPIAALLGQHRFMDLLVRLFDHLGKLLALIGLNPVKEPYVAG